MMRCPVHDHDEDRDPEPELVECGGCGAELDELGIHTCSADGCENEYCQHCGAEGPDGYMWCRACRRKAERRAAAFDQFVHRLFQIAPLT